MFSLRGPFPARTIPNDATTGMRHCFKDASDTARRREDRWETMPSAWYTMLDADTDASIPPTLRCRYE